jgi:putative ABC transport system ATP-binding protein
MLARALRTRLADDVSIHDPRLSPPSPPSPSPSSPSPAHSDGWSSVLGAAVAEATIASASRTSTDSPNGVESPVIVENVYKSYGRGANATPVLCGVSFSVRRGECVFLAGPSGSGKTTLLSILGCVLGVDRGSVRILGRDVSQLDRHARAALRRDGIGFVFQRFHLIRGLTALENVCVPLTLRGAPPAESRNRATALLESVGLADFAHQQPRNMSVGQCQRIALARALANDPDLILADEPTASLDAAHGQESMTLLRHLTAEAGRTAVIVTHDQRIFPFADRVLHLDNGRIVAPNAGHSP